MAPVVDFKGRNAIEAEARAWIVQLDGRTPTREDLTALREWAARSPQHAATLRDMADAWGALDGLAELRADIDALAARERRRRAERRRPALAAAGALAILLVGVAVWRALPFLSGSEVVIERSVHATVVGEQREVMLTDGSRVQINTNSVVEIAFSPGERRVRLVRGEALFDVAHDAARPFTVYADNSAARALGTQFVVRVEQGQVDVTVSEGAVELIARISEAESAPAGSHSVVSASHTATVRGDASVIRALEAHELERMLSWRDGVLVFEGEPLSEVVHEVSRYTPTRFVLADRELEDLRVGGRFGIGETEALLEALETGFGVSATRSDDVVITLSLAPSEGR